MHTHSMRCPRPLSHQRHGSSVPRSLQDVSRGRRRSPAHSLAVRRAQSTASLAPRKGRRLEVRQPLATDPRHCRFPQSSERLGRIRWGRIRCQEREKVSGTNIDSTMVGTVGRVNRLLRRRSQAAPLQEMHIVDIASHGLGGM